MKRKGQDMKLMVEIILAILGVSILVFGIILPSIRNHSISIFSTANKFGAAKMDFTNNYGITAQRITIDTASVSDICTSTKKDENGYDVIWECPKDKPQTFTVFVKNNGGRMLTVRGGIVVCKSGEKDCCGTTGDPSGVNVEYDCTITPGKEEPCAAGTYTFDSTYKEYEVHPLTDCSTNPKDGCAPTGMTTSVKSCNPDNYIIVKMV
jgi:hypothetical protein